MKAFVTPSAFVDAIVDRVADHLGLRRARLLAGTARTAKRARMLAMFMVRKLTALSYPEIGTVFDRDHSTVISACHRIETELARDEQLQSMVETLTFQLSGAIAEQPKTLTPSSCIRPAAREA